MGILVFDAALDQGRNVLVTNKNPPDKISGIVNYNIFHISYPPRNNRSVCVLQILFADTGNDMLLNLCLNKNKQSHMNTLEGNPPAHGI